MDDNVDEIVKQLDSLDLDNLPPKKFRLHDEDKITPTFKKIKE